ncbi:NAD(P)-dependent oxidoreductase [Acidobacteria bacterium AH-259-O06]|nr:NAD(P)-dependent oxidoreductase [Acidobacteria bacterium AH-259-O06]
MFVLLTGGFGYLAGRVVQVFSAKPGVGLRVLVHDMEPTPPGFPDSVEIRRGDVRNPESIRGLCDGVTHVIHLAGLDQGACNRSPADGLMVSGMGTLQVAVEAAASGVNRFVFVSSIHVYGAARADRLCEETPLWPLTPYGVSRAAGEAFARMVAHQRGLSVAVLRLSNGFGPPAYPGTACWNLVVNDLCRQAARRGKIVLRGNGKETRDIVAVTDIVRAIGLFATVEDERLAEGTFNIGGERVWSILEIAECVRDTYAELSHRQVPLHVGTAMSLAPPMPNLDMNRACALGFVPRADMRNEIRLTLAAAEGPLGEDPP